MVKYFRQYNLDADRLYLPEPVTQTVDEILTGFDPDNDDIERRILYEITGRKHADYERDDDDEFDGEAFEHDESSDDDSNDKGD
mmetsp:Transcript_4481/g.2967  ORF Transcript_4481/g.2967 Transcript_4481/m.2967 type:complete len:84 (+) Transcript_4481:1444-1695(+)|eukprot:CAMPEP_0116881738 /NCGR_PEP_ID=MMETSP0463-20121206/13802_1 /TAXON_ID=181622 /ORGANISM="Strombidinopsis sp, Strain SopsisLIS2011" /LENGTH=83 /DNA_ID=CAMNT_0004533887 /DNA_START=1359 /DNA_END=1610 /DNA_ORIENTATION=+